MIRLIIFVLKLLGFWKDPAPRAGTPEGTTAAAADNAPQGSPERPNQHR